MDLEPNYETNDKDVTNDPVVFFNYASNLVMKL